ncbi:putative ferric reductase transmembrane component [Candida viswanathii]|uniref:ferric-chelate reductase (NADPH) n=1 Tax=Candida viswanathii TaxID=5486 RepID=A0A367XQ80_9ASCO|nr:putative ferric reductase transmembrane component [Candida viswanathii]
MKLFLLLALAFVGANASNVPEIKNLEFIHYSNMKPSYACNLQVNNAATYCAGTSAFNTNYTCLCSSPGWVESVMGCLSYDNKNTTTYLDGLIRYCKIQGGVELTIPQLQDAYTSYVDNAVNTSTVDGYNKTEVIDYPVLLSQYETQLYRDAYDKYLGNYDDSLYYGAGIYGYWLLMFVVGSIVSWSRYLFPGLFTSNGFINGIRRNITLPALVGRAKTNARSLSFIEFLVPSRIESLVLAGFLALMIVLLSVNTGYIPGDPVLFSSGAARLRYVVDRCGIIATMMMPLVFLFAGRNNFLQWVTRWQYSRFVTFHRWTSRVMYCLIIIHASGYTKELGNFYSSALQEGYMKAGIVAAVSGGVMLMQGFLYLKRRWYEVFLIGHIVLAIMWVAGAWIHVQDLGYVYFLYPVLAVWFFDRFVRVIRLLMFGFPLADVTLISDETVKVSIPTSNYWTSIPGGHAFIHFLRPSSFWQSHPFTFTDSVVEDRHIVCFCKVKGGLTSSLYKYLSDRPGRCARIRVGVEGPYGEPTGAKFADTAVFIAGGNGIPGIYNEVTKLGKRSYDYSHQVVKLIWVIREYKSLVWFYDELKALKDSNIETTVYITKPDSAANFDDYHDKSSEKCDSSMKEKYTHYIQTEVSDFGPGSSDSDSVVLSAVKRDLSNVHFREGRPDIQEIVAIEVDECQKSVAFVACGHPIMVDDIRYAVARNVTNAGNKRVDYYEQLQVWA